MNNNSILRVHWVLHMIRPSHTTWATSLPVCWHAAIVYIHHRRSLLTVDNIKQLCTTDHTVTACSF